MNDHDEVITLTLIGKPDCHLCEVAGEVVEHVLAGLPAGTADRIRLEERSIQDDPVLHELWWEKIPVLLIDGRLHGHWRLSPERVRAAVLEGLGEGASG